MTIPPTRNVRTPSRAFQFRLTTLLIATVWAALICLGLRTPTSLSSSLIAFLTLLTLLMAILVVVYRARRTRAAAIGFIVFCGGYLIYSHNYFGLTAFGIGTPFLELLDALATAIHGDGRLTNEPFNLPRSVIAIDPPYQRADFIAICNHAIACLLGIAGAVASQMLNATQETNCVAL
jgi:hypothetical protein